VPRTDRAQIGEFAASLREAPALGLETIPLSEREVEYPAMLEMHDASSLESERK